jgi:cytochrome c peroxidase
MESGMMRVREVAGVWMVTAVAGAAFVAAPASRPAHAVSVSPGSSDWVWNLPPGVTPPAVPADNPMSRAKFELGRKLFYDRQLSGNNVLACSGCHLQSKAFADNLPRAVGATGEIHPRAAMMLVNVGYASGLTWSNPAETRLEVQARTPMFGTHPVEMGLAGKEPQLLARLTNDSVYAALFRASFPRRAAPISVTTVLQALATFERGLVSFDSPYDRATLRGDASALSPAARRGEALFHGERLKCASCHRGQLLDGSSQPGAPTTAASAYQNNGLYGIGPTRSYPRDNLGLAEFSGRDEDNGRFKVPSLRNIGVTAPYMHDGSVNTLDDVITHYARGGRVITSGAAAGDGALHPRKSPFVAGFSITAAERRDLLAFLHALTDSTVLRDPRFSDPTLQRR